MKPTKLFKTTIVIWTDYDTNLATLEYLAYEATGGYGYCDSSQCEEITDCIMFPDTEFFDI